MNRIKPTYYPILRIVLTLIAGVFMIVAPGRVLTYIAYVVGVLLMVPGLVLLVRYAMVRWQRNQRYRRNHAVPFPVLALLCTIAGLSIIVFSQEIVEMLSLVLAVGLLIAGIYEIVMIAGSPCRYIPTFYIVPVVLTLFGVFVLINPLYLLPHVIVVLFGVGAVMYSICEIIYMTRINR